MVEVGNTVVNHRVLAKLIEGNPEFTGQNIRLLSCNTGVSCNGIAQNLANKLNVDVKAPNDFLWIYPNGEITIGAIQYINTGEFILFQPKRK